MRYFSPAEAVNYLKEEHGLSISTASLRSWRSTGVGGPKFGCPVRSIEYSQADLDAWVTARRAKTFDCSAAAKTERRQRLIKPRLAAASTTNA